MVIVTVQVPRLTPYLSNGLFIVSERGVEPEQERQLADQLVFVPESQTRVSCHTHGVRGCPLRKRERGEKANRGRKNSSRLCAHVVALR